MRRRDRLRRRTGLADRLRDLPPRQFLERLALEVAGIRPGWPGTLDLALGGRDVIRGRGWRPEYSDGSRGQARHFVGLAAATVRFGPGPTRWVSVRIRRDPADSPDGRLTDAAIEFAVGILHGDLSVADAADWIRGRLCA
jgi:hypothetical protein